MRAIVCAALLTAVCHGADESVVPDGARVEKLWGDGEFTEGPAQARRGHLLLGHRQPHHEV
jgi:hypothetical protein